ncbi:putative glycine rich protein [Helianthus annuus]|uniref:Glycine rich protein n=1 Tax=Helianthus annuus TaxID=4232 RepID=A0A251RXA3_HELAN|nr:abscisic acid and environmental stress-inducible protein [Helianthus annuus]KAF5758867.1 putative glycine rich protein [Helianthus annuus]KAJ0437152.1 putative glycine rich protein [Helianthus annuus]KAJ0441530.1 putative glycine rich protein [Helianthus annuus]KAJ0459461.1 putative glycine rich protein [Helianthus annuus]KAJ0639987.1 putative glycine rich protein [Helianthus annuus]
MVSKRFLLIALAFATVLLITSEIAAAKELASNNKGEVEDAKYDRGYNGGPGGYYNGGGRGGYNNGGGRGGYYNGGGRGRRHCRHGCCGRYYNGGCSCCRTLEEANAYKQAQEAQTHN